MDNESITEKEQKQIASSAILVSRGRSMISSKTSIIGLHCHRNAKPDTHSGTFLNRGHHI
jgi:hypothetical protein